MYNENPMSRWKMFLILISVAVLFIAVCVWVGRVQAAPYLVGDSQPAGSLTHYVVERDVKDLTGTVTSTVTEQSDPQPVAGGVRLHFDLFGLPIGVHAMRVSAVRIENREGGGTYARSDRVPFLYESLSLPGPAGLKLSTE
jgi:hypothetical protein